MADFFERMEHLIGTVGIGSLSSECEADQIYARYQELGADFRHPGGGQAFAMRDSVFGNETQIMETFAETLLTEDGSDIKRGAERNAEKIAASYFEKAPIEFGDLKGSAHPTVVDDGAVIYDRPPAVHRLSEDELRAKGDLKRLGFGNDGITEDVASRLGIT